jgi:hypothetical protein
MVGSFPAAVPEEDVITWNAWIRGMVLLLAAALAVTGLLMAVGVLNREGIARELRIALGVTVFLYGSYKFTVTWFGQRGKRER